MKVGHICYGYAVTVHKARGRTCDHGLLRASDDTHGEMGYVGLNRGRVSNRLYLVDDEAADEFETTSGPARAGPARPRP